MAKTEKTFDEIIEDLRRQTEPAAAMILKATGAVKIRRGDKEVVIKGKTPLRWGDKVIVSKGANALILYGTGKKSTVTKTHTITKSNAKVARPTAAPEKVWSPETGQMELVEDRLPEPSLGMRAGIIDDVFGRARVPPTATPGEAISEILRVSVPKEIAFPPELEAPLQAFKALPAAPVAAFQYLTTGKQDVLGFNIQTGMFESKSPLEMGIAQGGAAAIAIGVAGEIFLDPLTYISGGAKLAFLPSKLMKGLKKTGELKTIIAAGRASQDPNIVFRLVKQTNAYDDFIKAGGKSTVGDKKRMAVLSKRLVGKQYTPESLWETFVYEPERIISAELSFLGKGKRTEKIASARRIISTSNTMKTSGVDIVSLENKLEATGAIVTKKTAGKLKDETKAAIKRASTIDEIADIIRGDEAATAAWEAAKLSKFDEERLGKLTKLVIPESHRSKSVIEVGEQTFDINTPGTLPIDVWKKALSRQPAEVYKFEKLLALGKKDEAYDILMKLDDVQEFIKTPRIQNKQYKSLYGVAKSKGLTRKHISRFAKEFYEVDDLRNLTFEQAGDLIKTVRSMKIGVKGKALIPKTKELLPIDEGALTRELGGEIGALGYARPSERTLTGAGLSDAVFEPLLIAHQHEVKNTLRALDEMKGVRDSVKHIKHHEEFIADLLEHPDDTLKILSGVEDAADAKALFEASQWHKNLYIDYAVRLGLPPDKIRKSYMPHIIDWVKNGKIRPDMPDELKKIIEFIPPGFQIPFRQARTGALTYKKDAWGAAHAYVIAAERELAYSGVTKAVLAKTKYMTPSAGKFVKKYIDNLGGRNIIQGFDDAVDISLRNSISAITFGKVDIGYKPFKRGVSAIANIVYGGALGLSPGSALKNLTQNLLTVEELGAVWLARGAAKSLTKEGKKLFDDSGIFMSRFSGDVGTEIVGKTGGVGYYANRALWAQFDAAEYANRIIAYNAAHVKYMHYAKKMGMPLNHATKRQAGKYAMAVVRRVQFAYGKLFTPLIVQTTPGRAALQFFTYPINWGEYQFGVVADAYKNIKSAFRGEIPAADLLFSHLKTTGEALTEMGVYKMPAEREFYRGFRSAGRIRKDPVIDKPVVKKKLSAGEYPIYRAERPGRTPTAEAPHGDYYSIIDDPSKSPHRADWIEEYGDVQDITGVAKPKNPLVVDEIWVAQADRLSPAGGPVPASTGIAALKKLIPEQEFNALMKLRKKELLPILKQKFPNVEWERYFDGYEMLEGYAGVLARKKGHDALILIDKRMPEFSEYVALSNKPLRVDKPATSKAISKGEKPFTVWERIGGGLEAGRKPVTWMVGAVAATEAGRRIGGFDIGPTLGTDVLPFEFDVETGKLGLKVPTPATGGVFPMQEDPITGEPEFGFPPIPQAGFLGVKALHALAIGDTELLERYKREGKRLGPLFVPGGRFAKKAADLFVTSKRSGLKYRMVGSPHIKPQIGDVPYGEMTNADMARYFLDLRSVESEKKFAEKRGFYIEQTQYDKDKDSFRIEVLRGNIKKAKTIGKKYDWETPKTDKEMGVLWDAESTKYRGAVTNIVLDNLIYESREAAERSYNLLMDDVEENKIFPKKYMPYVPNRTTATNKLKLLLKEAAPLEGDERKYKMGKVQAVAEYLSGWDPKYYTVKKLWEIHRSVIPEE